METWKGNDTDFYATKLIRQFITIIALKRFWHIHTMHLDLRSSFLMEKLSRRIYGECWQKPQPASTSHKKNPTYKSISKKIKISWSIVNDNLNGASDHKKEFVTRWWRNENARNHSKIDWLWLKRAQKLTKSEQKAIRRKGEEDETRLEIKKKIIKSARKKEITSLNNEIIKSNQRKPPKKLRGKERKTKH